VLTIFSKKNKNAKISAFSVSLNLCTLRLGKYHLVSPNMYVSSIINWNYLLVGETWYEVVYNSIQLHTHIGTMHVEDTDKQFVSLEMAYHVQLVRFD